MGQWVIQDMCTIEESLCYRLIVEGSHIIKIQPVASFYNRPKQGQLVFKPEHK